MAKLVVGQNDLASQCPEVAAEWDYEKNGDVTPEMVCYKSSKKYWWICSKHGVSWETKVTVRTRGHGCPQCAHEKKVRTNGTLADRFPEIAAEWHPTLNGDVTPNDVTGCASSKVWWLGRCGHEWDMTVANRTTLGQGCPYCIGKRVLAGFNDLSTTDPDVADEWDYERNGDLKPTSVSHGSSKVVWWKCGSCGFSWRQAISKRVQRGNDCPSCGAPVKKVLRRPTHGMTLADAYPDIAAEWHPTKNGVLIPSDLTGGAQQRVWWLGKCGHEWDASIYARTRLGTGCPYCAGQRAIAGVNDLATTNPSLAAEWHPTKNGDLTPSDVMANSHKSVWWVCQSGHEWQTTVKNRNREGSGCPICSRSSHTSFPENAILFYVGKAFDDVIPSARPKEFGFSRYELDIFIPSIMSAVEYDGEIWHDNSERDSKKDDLCRKAGIRLIRVREPNCAEYDNPHAEVVIRKPATGNESLNQSIRQVLAMLEADVDVDVERDYADIRKLMTTTIVSKNVADEYPDIASQWHPTKNGDLDPRMFRPSSREVMWWVCPKGHEYKSRINHRCDGHGCPECANEAKRGPRKPPKDKSLAALFPEEAAEWDVEMNDGIKPDEVSCGSSYVAWWKCSICGLSYQRAIDSRVKHSRGCPACAARMRVETSQAKSPARNARRHMSISIPESLAAKTEVGVGSRVITGINDLQTLKPEIAAQWIVEKNGGILASEVSANSNRKAWWRCSECGQEWEAVISNRSYLGRGCPECAHRRNVEALRTPKPGRSLADVNPELAGEWHESKNGDLLPSSVNPSSSRKVWWHGSCGHEWEASISNRAKGKGCPFCSGRIVLPGFNDLATAYPEIAKEWHPTKNGTLTPDMVTAKSGKKVWWLGECGHEWEANVSNRAKGCGCRYCKGKAIWRTRRRNMLPKGTQLTLDFGDTT